MQTIPFSRCWHTEPLHYPGVKDHQHAELLMGRNIRSTLPVPSSTLVPEWSYIEEFRQANEKLKQQQKADYDRRHRVRDLPEIPNDTDVWVTTGGHPIPGRTIAQSDNPRSYTVQTPTGEHLCHYDVMIYTCGMFSNIACT